MNTREEILNVLKEKGIDWVVAAMIEGSRCLLALCTRRRGCDYGGRQR